MATNEEYQALIDSLSGECERLHKENEKLKALSQEPCDDAQERYEDLCEYFGGAKDILKSREDFKAWLGRVKWHIRKAEELYEKYEYKQEPCDDAISRDAVKDWFCTNYCSEHNQCEHFEQGDCNAMIELFAIPSVTQKSGKWQVVSDGYGDSAYICECSECKDTVWVYKNADRKWKYCPNCGAKMVEPQESEDKE